MPTLFYYERKIQISFDRFRLELLNQKFVSSQKLVLISINESAKKNESKFNTDQTVFPTIVSDTVDCDHHKPSIKCTEQKQSIIDCKINALHVDLLLMQIMFFKFVIFQCFLNLSLVCDMQQTIDHKEQCQNSQRERDQLVELLKISCFSTF